MARERRKPARSKEIQTVPTEPWDKQPGESTQAFAAFAHYRDSGARRSLVSTAEHYRETIRTDRGGTSPASTYQQMAEWSARHRWPERIEQFTIAQDRAQRLAREERRREIEELQAQAGRTLTLTGLTRMRGAAATSGRAAVAPIDANDLDPAEARQMIQTGFMLERLAVGLPTDLTRGVDSFTRSEVESLLRDVIDLSMPFVDTDQHEGWLRLLRERVRRIR